MKFRTEIKPEAAPFQLSASDRVLLVGSCFSDNIGSRLSLHGCPAVVNPCGVQYNPASIASLLRAAMSGCVPQESFFSYNGRVRSWMFPQAFSGLTREEAEAKCGDAFAVMRDALLNSQALIVTFGTAQVWRHLLSATSAYEGVVGNCHTVPSGEFLHTMLSVEDIVEEWSKLLGDLRSLNPELKVIFTVSPVRHLNPSPRLNTLSKASLHLAVAQIVASNPSLNAYFPAYELLIDDLRDYRFYAVDMSHPSVQAADYIFMQFADCYYSASDREAMHAAFSASLRASHRPLLK